jgi:hypothetical protein
MNRFQKLFFLLLFSIVSFGAWASVSEYSFASTPGAFTEISGGTILGTAANDNESFNAIPLGFTFTYNGVDYTDTSIQTNGFLAMGLTVLTTNQAISTATSSNNVVAALNRDIKSRDTGELMYLMSGTAPDRIFTVQWKHYRRAATATASDDFSFQIQLQENGNKVCFVYGAFSTVTATTAASIQVGLRGDSNADFNNRTTTTDWSATTAGTANNSFCSLSQTVFPANGLTFMFTPPVAGEPPTAAQNPVPVNNAINVALAANLGWTAGSGTIDGYKVFLGTDNPPTNLVNGTIQTALTYNPADFIYNTAYYWQIVPFNTFGDALNCPVWSFTTLADPTVSTFPFTENFDTAAVPALPPGWTTINANNDSNTWETYAGNYDTSPHSVRVRFNQILAMNDWLIMPPMQLIQDISYKVRFFYRATSTNLPEKLALYWGNAPTVDSLADQIFVDESVDMIVYTPGEAIVTPTASGVYYFGFKGFSEMNMYYLYLDTVSIAEWIELLNPPTSLTATVNDFDVHLAWAAPTQERSLLGYTVYRNDILIANIVGADSVTYDDIGLTSGLYSYKVTALYTSGESVPAGPVLADVAPVVLPPLNLTASVLERDVTLNWNNPEGDWITWSNMVLGNSVGTNSAVVFDVAHRWAQEDLAPYAGRSISRIQFVPTYTNCIYTIKIWTGGSASGAGTMVYSQVVSNIVLNEWNTVLLNALVPIPATGELYYGYECNTQGGTPAGCDAGPQIDGKGNMMFFGGSWQTLTTIAPTLTYNWSIRAFAQYAAPARVGELTPITELLPYSSKVEPLICSRFTPVQDERVINGYKVYRNSELIATLSDAEIFTYLDAGLANGTYTYGVTSTSSTGESVPATVEAVVNFQLAATVLEDGFEDYPDFALTFAPWTVWDVDHAATYVIPGVDFPGSGSAMGYIIFNPSATTPPLTTLVPHGGSKMATAFSSAAAVCNNWLVTPRIHLGTNSSIKFFARSHDAARLARYRVALSTLPTNVPGGLTNYVTGATYVEAPANWHEYVYDLSAFDGQNIFLGIRCVSDTASVFYVDDISVHSDGGFVGNDDPVVPVFLNALVGNYPNPFYPETTIRYSTAAKGPVNIDIYNLKGQLVRHLVNENKAAGNYNIVFDGKDSNGRSIASGVYYCKMKAGNFNSTKKMILIK